MDKTAIVMFDGEILRPEGPIEMGPNTRYVIAYEAPLPAAEPRSIWEVFKGMAGTVEAIPDWSEEHDHYIHGTPKRHPEAGV